MKKTVILILILCIQVFMISCNNQTVEDAQSLADNNNIVKDIQDSAYKYNLSGDGALAKQELKKEDNKLNIVEKHDEFEQYGFIGQIEETLLTEDVKEVSVLTGNDEFADWLIKTKGPDSQLGNTRCWISDNGVINYNKTKKVLFIKMKLKNVSSNDLEICMWPSLYTHSGDDFIAIRSGIEGMGYDKNMVINNQDALYHIFKAGEELETTMAFQIKFDVEKYDNMYISTAFLKPHQSENQLPDGCSMLELQWLQ